MSLFSPGLRALITIVCLLLVAACSDSSDSPARVVDATQPPNDNTDEIDEGGFRAQLTWTEFGIPHVQADDWGGLGYGTGFSFAELNYCTMMGQFVVARGETARYFGGDGNLQIDFVWKLLNSEERIASMLDALSPDAAALIEGYAAGFNRYRRDLGPDNLPRECRGAAWVRDIDSTDVMRAIHRLVLFASGDGLAPFIAAPEAPAAEAMSAAGPLDLNEKMLAGIAPETLARKLALPHAHAVGSNAYAVGGESSQSGSGVLLSNPHLFWDVPLRYTMLRQTMGDQLDVMGATPFGVPIVGVGFNQNMAWAITVSTSNRFTLYELQLEPDNPLRYVYDGETRELEAHPVFAEQVLEDGSVERVEKTFYLSQFGPVIDLGAVSPLLGGWPNALGTLLVYRDANLGNARVVDQWMSMGMAANVAELQDATRAIGQPFLNTLATDRFGDVFFGNISVSANVSDAQLNSCVTEPLGTLLTSSGFLTLDGSNAFCDWGSDEDAPEPGLFGWNSLPKLETRDYAANANDSHWMTNPRQLLEGFPSSLGAERSELSIRTRHAFAMAEERRAGTDGLGPAGFDIDTVRELMYRADNYAAALTQEDVVAACQSLEDWTTFGENPALYAEACAVLQAWDGAHRLDSMGAQVFWEMWQVLRLTPGLWSVPFDVTDPLNTPRGINASSDEISEAVNSALAAAAERLNAVGVALDATWGNIQFEEKNGERYGIHGGDESMMFSAIVAGLVEGEGYSDITLGNTYIQAVTWDESDCPNAFAVLTYSQSTNPMSPHFADATQLYSESRWIDMPFCQADVDAAEIDRLTLSE
ncbi:MAG: penicillin acylase family protein [Pseudomonadota bacterium]